MAFRNTLPSSDAGYITSRHERERNLIDSLMSQFPDKQTETYHVLRILVEKVYGAEHESVGAAIDMLTARLKNVEESLQFISHHQPSTAWRVPP
jgi:hypothetical protein